MPKRLRVLPLLAVAFLCFTPTRSQGEVILQLFNVNWDELQAKMPEIAEAGYTALWLPPPAKAGSVFSVGYDLFDPFDLGDKNQRGTVRTRYGTKDQLLQVVELAHRMGMRVYFDNIMNHRGFDIPSFNASTPTNVYPGLSPRDFHLMVQSDGYLRNWPSIAQSDYDAGDVFAIQNKPLSGLIDLATESGSINDNYGLTYGSTTNKPVYIRQPTNREYYMDTNLPVIAGAWRPFNGTNGDPVAEDVNGYLIRAALWMLNETKCDGFRFDAVKHVPSVFYGNDAGATPDGYTGAIQTMFDYVHGYGSNAVGNGYIETDDSRNSCYDSEAPRNDALLFGEHQGQPPPYGDYLIRGMRLLDSPLRDTLNGVLGNPNGTLAGLEQRDSGGFSAPDRIMYVQSHDNGGSTHRELQVAYMLMREGIATIYSDGYNQSGPPDYFPTVANAPYLGEFGDNKMPDMAYLHNQLARGGTRPRWGDTDVVAFERYDYRETTDGANNPDATTVLFAMNDNYASDISFDDGVAQSDVGMPSTCYPVSSTRGVGLVVGFPPGSVLSQLADSPNSGSACPKVLVRQATASQAEADSTKNDPNPVNRKIYVGGQTLMTGGGAIECKIPSGGYVCYGYQWPQASRAVEEKPAITLRQNGVEAPHITVFRKDGVNGDTGFDPIYPFKMRGKVDQFGNIITGTNATNLVYAIDVPIITNANFDIIARSDASAVNMQFKLDGGVDLNSQLGLGSTNLADLRDNRPGIATDVFLGYEQSMFDSRFGPEKFAARSIASNNIVSSGAETFRYIVGGTNFIASGTGYGAQYTTSTATWVQHNPTNLTTVSNVTAVTMRSPFAPTNNQAADIWVKVGFKLQIDRCFIYYTTDGTNPEGAFGVGSNSTKVVEAHFAGPDTVDNTIDWWKGTIAGSNNITGKDVRYKISLVNDNIGVISDADDSKFYGVSEYSVTNFNPMAAKVWLANDLNPANSTTGLREGFHIIRVRAFLPRSGKSSVYNTFLQTFYYDASAPQGVIATPVVDNTSISNVTYQVVVRADSSVTSAEFNIQDGDASNDDDITGGNNGNGNTNGQPKFALATSVTAATNLTAQYPAYPQEFRFNYTAVPTNGTATITVRLKEASTAIFPSRVTTLTRTVKTVSPGQTLLVADPVAGQIIEVATNDAFTLAACFSSTLATFSQIDLFSVYANGVFLPRRDTNGVPLYTILASGCDAGQRQLVVNWGGSVPGSNSVQVVYTNSLILSDALSFLVVRPGDSDGDGMSDAAELVAGTDPYDSNSVLRITQLANGNHLVVWDSVPGVNYQVLAGTNLNQPLQVVSPVIPAGGASSFYFDDATNSAERYFRIQVVQ